MQQSLISHPFCYRTVRSLPALQQTVSRPRRVQASIWRRQAPALFNGPPRQCRCSAGNESAGRVPGKRTAVIIVDHGSRRLESNQQLEEFVQLYRESHLECEAAIAAHMEIASPSIADGISRCAQEGFDRVVVAPYFLSQGRHIQQDIPALVAEAQKQHPGLECVIADPIGIDQAVAAVIHERVQAAVSKSGT